MPRDANGNYTLPSGNPVVTNTLISSTWANDTMSDLANEMQDSLSRSGKGGLTGPLGVVDKSGSVPGLNFIAEPTSGLKREASEDVRIQITAVDVLQVTKTGVKALNGGSLKDVAVEEAGQKIMRGVGGTTVVAFYNATPPTGWTLLAPDTNLRSLIVSPTAGGTIAGSVDPTNLTQTLAVTISGTTTSVGDHTHDYSGTTGASNNNTGVVAPGGESVGENQHGHSYSGTTGGGGAHSHTAGTLAGSGNVSIAPRYALVVLGTLDA